jgi:RNA polymerase sigma factor (TIGR02999 family)
MSSSKPIELTRILDAARAGDEAAAHDVWKHVYGELHALAAIKLARTPPHHTLRPTDLVHEAYLKLGGSEEMQWQNRAHFFGAAAQAMRNILVDHARRNAALKHGGGQRRVSLSQVGAPPRSSCDPIDVLALNSALDALDAHDPRAARLTTLRYFAGLTVAEAARTLGISTATAERDWRYARAWLHQRVTSGAPRPRHTP